MNIEFVILMHRTGESNRQRIVLIGTEHLRLAVVLRLVQSEPTVEHLNMPNSLDQLHMFFVALLVRSSYLPSSQVKGFTILYCSTKIRSSKVLILQVQL